MDPDAVLQQLLEREVVTAGADGEVLELSSPYRREVEARRERLDTATGESDAIEGHVDDEDTAGALTAFLDTDPSFVACFLALNEFDLDLTDQEQFQITLVIQQFRDETPPLDGVPEWFLPVAGDQLEAVLQVYPLAVVVVWQDDCEESRLVKESFEEIFADQPTDIAPIAVYGPNWEELLYERYQVARFPTTLFVVDGSVDSRLIGAHHTVSYENEIDIIRDK